MADPAHTDAESADASNDVAQPLPLVPRRIALVAHDDKKKDLLAWARYNRATLAGHELLATGTTGSLLEEQLRLPVARVQSGPLGGDLQIGARIAEGQIDLLVFFWDPLASQPHDSDVRALLRIAVVWNVPVACNRATADFLISSPLLRSAYERAVPRYLPSPGELDRRHSA
ncbi:MAG TPA: methylglyoxal synthase [Acidimicrobiales bacterium]|nr:methylglyoxal synthase [Acidimicrobiales bacterium]